MLWGPQQLPQPPFARHLLQNSFLVSPQGSLLAGCFVVMGKEEMSLSVGAVSGSEGSVDVAQGLLTALWRSRCAVLTSGASSGVPAV